MLIDETIVGNLFDDATFSAINLLDRSGVDAISEKVNEYLTKAEVKQENAIRLTMDELLLDADQLRLWKREVLKNNP